MREENLDGLWELVVQCRDKFNLLYSCTFSLVAGI